MLIKGFLWVETTNFATTLYFYHYDRFFQIVLTNSWVTCVADQRLFHSLLIFLATAVLNALSSFFAVKLHGKSRISLL